ncbi:MAG: hypothetical protein OSA98_19590 [Rubripirellula sp.]|nr:hypothetical protein [Rubripirellula sp.]
MGRKYRFFKQTDFEGRETDEMPEGTPVIWTLLMPEENQVSITNDHLSRETVTNTLLKSGFREVKWHSPQIDSVAIQMRIGSHFCNHLPLPSPSVLSETIEIQGIRMSECSTGVNEFPNACQQVTDSLQQRF